MLKLEQAIRTRDVMDTLIDKIHSNSYSIMKVVDMNGDTTYSITFKAHEVVYASKKGHGFFESKYQVYYDGVMIEVPSMIARRLYKTMEQSYAKQMHKKMCSKISKLEELVYERSPESSGPVAPTQPATV